MSSWLQGRGEMNGTYLVALLFLLVLVGLRSLLRPDLLPEFLEAGFLLLLGQWSDLFSGFREVGVLAIMRVYVSVAAEQCLPGGGAGLMMGNARLAGVELGGGLVAELLAALVADQGHGDGAVGQGRGVDSRLLLVGL